MKIPQQYSDPTLNLALDTLASKKQAIVFVNTKNSAEKTAEEIAKKVKEKTHVVLAEKALHSLSSPTKQCQRLAKCLEKGIAFHHAGLTSQQKELIEDSFRNKEIKVIAATPTLAAGLDLPAYRVILKDLRRFGRRGLQYIPVLEYLQMAGRAGRPKYDTKGQAITVSSSEDQKEELTNRYLHGEPESIYSKLAVEPVLRTYVLSLIASKFATSKKSLFDFFSQTFWAHQFGDTQKLFGIIEKTLQLLEEWEFIIGSDTSEQHAEFTSASDLLKEDTKYKATILGSRVAQLYIDPYTAHYFVEALQRGAQRSIAPFSILHIVSSTLEIRPQLKAKTKEFEKIQEALLTYGDDLLDKEPSIYDEDYEQFQNAIKTALFFQDWIDEKGEEFLLEEYAIRPGEIKAKLDIADWLIYCMDEMARILSFKDLIAELKKLRVRLQYGVKEEIITLLKLKNIGRVRARNLYKNGIKDIAAVKAADFMKLSQILGKNIAIDVKEQVGQKVEQVKENKRKGQISLKDY